MFKWFRRTFKIRFLRDDMVPGIYFNFVVIAYLLFDVDAAKCFWWIFFFFNGHDNLE